MSTMEEPQLTNYIDSFCEQLGKASNLAKSSNSSNDFSRGSCNVSEFEKDLANISECCVEIKLVGNKPLVWKPVEWLKLQKNRIHGTLIGIPANFPKQVTENALPLLLLPEEVTLILERNLGKIYRYKKARTFPSPKVKETYNNYLKRNREEQEEYYKNLCRQQVLERIDLIIEGKKKKNCLKKQKTDEASPEVELDRESLIEIEVERKLKAATSTHLVQIPTASPWLTAEDLEPVDWNFPETSKEKLKYLVFKDLYDKGYSLTPCAKFGGDFLAYPGDSWKFHAYFIVVCLEFDEEFKLSDLVTNSRVSIFTRKNFVIASQDENGQLFYNTITWPTRD